MIIFEMPEESIGELEAQLKEMNVIEDKQPLTKDNIKHLVYGVLVTEGAGDEGLAKLILAYCEMVDYEYEAVLPILKGDVSFFSDLENMGHLGFYLQKSLIDLLKKGGKYEGNIVGKNEGNVESSSNSDYLDNLLK